MPQREEETILATAWELVEKLAAAGLTIACAESCTGGLAQAAITSIPGASHVFWGGFVTYSNDCKTRIAGVSLATLETCGAVSRETAREMASGSLAASGADIAFAITGIAGPEGGSAEKPVGSVWIAWKAAVGTGGEEFSLFHGDRKAIREASVLRALRGACDLVNEFPSEGDDIDNREGAVYIS